MRFVVPDCLGDTTLAGAFEERLARFPDAKIFRDPPSSEDELVRRVESADAIILHFEGARLTDTALAGSPGLQVVSICGADKRCVDAAAADRLGIAVRNTPQAATPAVAEMTVAAMLSLSRNLHRLNADVHSGEWPREYGIDLNGKTLGLVGIGRIGERVASIARAIGMSVIAWSPNLTAERAADCGAKHVPLDRLLAEADVISLHLRLSDTTAGILDRAALERIRPGVFVINTSRAGLVDEDALWTLLRQGRIAGAALDVFPDEPLEKTHRWGDMPNVILTPHTAWRTHDTIGRFIDRALENALEALKSAPRAEAVGR